MIKDFTIKGEWFLPSSPTYRVHGTLKFHPTEGADLELYGSLYGEGFFPGFKDQDVILGLSSDSKQITLSDCYMTKSGGTTLVKGGESGKPSVSYSIGYILIGLHVNSPDDLIFNKISSEIFNLDEWIGISGFVNHPTDFSDNNRYKINVEYKLPEPIKFQIDKETNGRFNFTANHPGISRYQKTVNITQRVQFQAETKTEKSIGDLLKYILSFQNFLILALYRSTFPISITLSGEKHKNDYGDGKTYKKDIKLYFAISNFKEHEKLKLDFEMIFSYKRIKENFPVIIKNWFAKYELLEPAFNLVFEQFYNGNRFTENTFLNLAQSAETFHARIHNHTRIPKPEYKSMKEEILKVSPIQYHGWLKDQFNFGNNLNLHARLTELTEKYSNEILDQILGAKEQFVLNVKNSRNYYTHYSNDGKKKALKGTELFYLSERLKILLVCSFLEEIGLPKDKLALSLDKLKWILFNHLTNWREEKK
ncbi:hypothetical protein I2I11_01650 [Pontibacter sp. 172403-2]|uniref:ApeA N-terminal domain 1-containing protein n=1 Tax=Pontibacter rufus TaxID=2791028 RepID=UPI0018AFE91F|nr:HEPN domain-containing protein [Pontibacter sp. 172403-2]MBF9251988.1 hypothetical protein [Pontibacter sp. 172403-2]